MWEGRGLGGTNGRGRGATCRQEWRRQARAAVTAAAAIALAVAPGSSDHPRLPAGPGGRATAAQSRRAGAWRRVRKARPRWTASTWCEQIVQSWEFPAARNGGSCRCQGFSLVETHATPALWRWHKRQDQSAQLGSQPAMPSAAALGRRHRRRLPPRRAACPCGLLHVPLLRACDATGFAGSLPTNNKRVLVVARRSLAAAAGVAAASASRSDRTCWICATAVNSRSVNTAGGGDTQLISAAARNISVESNLET